MNEVFLHISAGGGPKECEWVVIKLASAFAKEARTEGLQSELLVDDEDVSSTMPSVLMRFSGRGVEAFVKARLGSIRWIGNSPFRKNNKRRNWFVGVSMAPDISNVPDLVESDIRYQAMKASGPGGQHVNATQSAVRATHVPTGISVVAREERSQHANKRLCRIKLALIFSARQTENAANAKQNLWQQNQNLERGNEIRIYEGPKFKLK